METPEITPAAIRLMSYNELISIVRETNRPPGGVASIAHVARATFLGPSKSVLDVGCATGFTALSIAALTGAAVTGIDVNETSLAEAAERAKSLNLRSVSFEATDATCMPFPDDSFDVVFCGNVTSLIDEAKAVPEYVRVLKPHGFLAAVPMYYLLEPEPAILDAICRAINIQITPRRRDEATRIFRTSELDVFDETHWRFREVSRAEVAAFCQKVLSKSHLRNLPDETKSVLSTVYAEHMELFRTNLMRMGYSISILLKRPRFDEGELFSGEQIEVS